MLAGPILFTVAALLVMGAARGVRGSLAALILFAAADLGCYGMSYSVYSRPTGWSNVAAAAAMPPADLGGRVYAPPQPMADDCKALDRQPDDPGRVASGRGYAGLEPQRQLDYAVSARLASGGHRLGRARPGHRADRRPGCPAAPSGCKCPARCRGCGW